MHATDNRLNAFRNETARLSNSIALHRMQLRLTFQWTLNDCRERRSLENEFRFCSWLYNGRRKKCQRDEIGWKQLGRMWKKLDEILRNRCWYSKSCQRECLWKRHQRVPSSERVINSYAWRQLRIQWRHVLFNPIGFSIKLSSMGKIHFRNRFPVSSFHRTTEIGWHFEGNFLVLWEWHWHHHRTTAWNFSHHLDKNFNQRNCIHTKSFLFLRREKKFQKAASSVGRCHRQRMRKRKPLRLRNFWGSFGWVWRKKTAVWGGSKSLDMMQLESL